MSINDLIDKAVKCLCCGVQGFGNCACWHIKKKGKIYCDTCHKCFLCCKGHKIKKKVKK